MAHGGRQAAVARQAPPEVTVSGSKVTASVGRWDPGIVLEAVWLVNGNASSSPFGVKQEQELSYPASSGSQLQLAVTGTKRDSQE